MVLLFLMWLPKGEKNKNLVQATASTKPYIDRKKGESFRLLALHNALTRPAGIIIPGNANGAESYLYGVGFELREDREGCGFAYRVGVGDRTRRRRRAAEGEEEALGGVGHVGGSIHRAGPRRLHPLFPARPRFPPRHCRARGRWSGVDGWMLRGRGGGKSSSSTAGKRKETSRGILGGARNRLPEAGGRLSAVGFASRCVGFLW